MERCFGNIYKNARMVAGLTQERWSEYLGVSPDTVRNYESGRTIPDEETLLCMADISGMKILPYQHLSQKSRIASGILPELEQEKGLPEAVLGLLIQIDDFREQKSARSIWTKWLRVRCSNTSPPERTAPPPCSQGEGPKECSRKGSVT